MRLLNTSSLVLQDFIGDTVPRYAILSHTWGEEEILFQDLQSGDNSWREKKSFKKVSGFCSLSKQDGYEWCWIDTCCIDKSSSAELSEAINSMFRWYANSYVCIVYLADVQLDHRKPDKLKSFKDSRWHRRGWTLQELLAPESVVFYDLDWNLAGTGFSLRDRISKITGIRADILKTKFDIGEARNCYCVAEKMSWAANRQTSRVEDMAYCLFGIFDVNMPLLYGEGDRAFKRLQLQILAETEDLTLLAWQGCWGSQGLVETYQDSYRPNQLLAPSPEYFARNTDFYRYQELVACSYREIIRSTNSQLDIDGKELLLIHHMEPTKRVDTLILNGVISGNGEDHGQDALVLCKVHRPSSCAPLMRFLCLPLQVREKSGNLVYRKRGIPTVRKIDSRPSPKVSLRQKLAISLEPDPEFWGLRHNTENIIAMVRTIGLLAILLNLQCPNRTVRNIFKVSGAAISAILLYYKTEEIIVIYGWRRYETASKLTVLPWTVCTSREGFSAMRKEILAEDNSWNIGDFQRRRLKNGSHISCRIKRVVAQWSPSYRKVISESTFGRISLWHDGIFSLDVSVISAGGGIEPITFIGAKSFLHLDQLNEWLDDENLMHRRDVLLEQNEAG